jgi:hypothetical protein
MQIGDPGFASNTTESGVVHFAASGVAACDVPVPNVTCVHLVDSWMCLVIGGHSSVLKPTVLCTYLLGGAAAAAVAMISNPSRLTLVTQPPRRLAGNVVFAASRFCTNLAVRLTAPFDVPITAFSFFFVMVAGFTAILACCLLVFWVDVYPERVCPDAFWVAGAAVFCCCCDCPDR